VNEEDKTETDVVCHINSISEVGLSRSGLSWATITLTKPHVHAWARLTLHHQVPVIMSATKEPFPYLAITRDALDDAIENDDVDQVVEAYNSLTPAEWEHFRRGDDHTDPAMRHLYEHGLSWDAVFAGSMTVHAKPRPDRWCLVDFLDAIYMPEGCYTEENEVNGGPPEPVGLIPYEGLKNVVHDEHEQYIDARFEHVSSDCDARDSAECMWFDEEWHCSPHKPCHLEDFPDCTHASEPWHAAPQGGTEVVEENL
jgi:hypothetical protein